MSEPNRYQRAQTKKLAIEKHVGIVNRLGRDVRQQFDQALEDLTEPTPCIAEGIPSAWTDWDSNPEYREPYETDRPSRQSARLMCEKCPLLELCLPAALARGEQHGIWSGTLVELGKVVQ